MTTQQMLDEIKKKIGRHKKDFGNGYIEMMYYDLSLSRVLSALKSDVGYGNFWGHNNKIEYYDQSVRSFPRKLLNNDGSDSMLNDQSEETIKAIREIVCK